MSFQLLAWARRWFDPETVARFFEPPIADWQHEYQEAAGPLARLVATIRGVATLLFVACWMVPRRLAAPIPVPVITGAMTAAALFCVPVTLLLMLPYLKEWAGAPAQMSFLTFGYLLPSTVAIALPLSMVVIVDRIRRDHEASDYDKPRLVAQFALLLALVMLVMVGWIVPQANQDWREAIASMSGRVPVRGLRELTLIELLGLPAATAEIWNRILLIGLPLFFAAVRWILPPIIIKFGKKGRLSLFLGLLGVMLTFSLFRLTGFTAGFARGPYPMGSDGLFYLVLGMAIIAAAYPQGDWPGQEPYPSRSRSVTR